LYLEATVDYGSVGAGLVVVVKEWKQLLSRSRTILLTFGSIKQTEHKSK